MVVGHTEAIVYSHPIDITLHLFLNFLLLIHTAQVFSMHVCKFLTEEIFPTQLSSILIFVVLFERRLQKHLTFKLFHLLLLHQALLLIRDSIESRCLFSLAFHHFLILRFILITGHLCHNTLHVLKLLYFFALLHFVVLSFNLELLVKVCFLQVSLTLFNV